MKYVDKNLIPGEKVIYTAKLHWIIFVSPLFTVALGIMIAAVPLFVPLEKDLNIVALLLSALFLLAGLLMVLQAFIKKMTTELAVTSKRVIAKFGFIRREIIELNHHQVESFLISQSILGRILDYGTLSINGTGVAHAPIPTISKPLKFRRNAMQAIDSDQAW